MSEYPEIAARFAQDTANHQMTVLHEEGLYRHLRFRSPRTIEYWFDIVTWPGSLIIRGDVGDDYVFTREQDMLPFFRGHEVNPYYWAQKLGGGRHSVMEYSEELLRQRVVEQFVSDARWDGVPAGSGKALRTWVLNEDLSDEREARSVVEAFAHRGYEFSDVWEWNFHDYEWSFLWCCHAIVWGIGQYDAAKAAPKAVA